MDLYWRARLVSAVSRENPRDILDLATGSGDVAFALARRQPSARVVGMDFCAPMLEEAETKKSLRQAPNVAFMPGDAMKIPAPDASFDVVTIAFGLRNVADRARCLSEVRRVLRPAGSLVVLEFSQPWHWVRPFYSFYLARLAPRIAGALTGEPEAYDYLRTSIGAFPDRDGLTAEIRAAKFAGVTATAMTMGIVALHVASR